MTKVMDLERALEHDPLAIRLSHTSVSPMSSDLRVRVTAAATSPRRAKRRHRRWIAGISFGALVISLAMFVTPAGAAVARVVLPSGLQQFFGIVSGAPTQLPAPPGASARHGSASAVPCSQVDTRTGSGNVLCYPDLSLRDAQRQVDFAIPTLSALPGNLTFRGALVESPRSAMISYRVVNAASGGLGLWIREDTPLGGPAVPASAIQPLQVNGSAAYYVHGDYEDAGPGTAAHWNPNGDAEELTWQHNGMTFDLSASGLHLSSAAFIQIAESVR